MKLCVWTVRIKGETVSYGSVEPFDHPEQLIVLVLSKFRANLQPTDILQVEASVFGRKTAASRKDTCLGTVLVAEYPVSQFIDFVY